MNSLAGLESYINQVFRAYISISSRNNSTVRISPSSKSGNKQQLEMQQTKVMQALRREVVVAQRDLVHDDEERS